MNKSTRSNQITIIPVVISKVVLFEEEHLNHIFVTVKRMKIIISINLNIPNIFLFEFGCNLSI